MTAQADEGTLEPTERRARLRRTADAQATIDVAALQPAIADGLCSEGACRYPSSAALASAFPYSRRPPAIARRNSLRAAVFGVFKLAAERLGDHSFVTAPIFAEQQAQLFGLDDTGCAARFAVPHQGVGDIAESSIPDR
jgi:hypothetical protein